jgi:hypothetical protein
LNSHGNGLKVAWYDVREQDAGPDDVLEWKVLVHDQGHAHAEHQLEDCREPRIDEGVADGLEEDGLLEQVLVVLQADEIAETDDPHVAQAVPDADDKGISDEDGQQ